MQPLAVAGAACTLCALVGFAVGAVAAYPGRELSMVGLMVGIALFFVGRGEP